MVWPDNQNGQAVPGKLPGTACFITYPVRYGMSGTVGKNWPDKWKCQKNVSLFDSLCRVSVFALKHRFETVTQVVDDRKINFAISRIPLCAAGLPRDSRAIQRFQGRRPFAGLRILRLLRCFLIRSPNFCRWWRWGGGDLSHIGGCRTTRHSSNGPKLREFES